MNYYVLGGGVSGLAAAELVASLPHQSITIINDKDLSADQVSAFLTLGCAFAIGAGPENTFAQPATLIVSPGFSPSHPFRAYAAQHNIPAMSEIDLARKHFYGKVIGITGTNGKSTVTAMIEHILRRLGRGGIACGNIGVAFSAAVMRVPSYAIAAVELSSYQLESSHSLRANVALFTSFSHDHLARHGSRREYFLAKWKLLVDMQRPRLIIMTSDVWQEAILHVDAFDPEITYYVLADFSAWQGRLPESVRPIWLSDSITRARREHDDLLINVTLSGQLMAHNRLNALMAVLAVSGLCGDTPLALMPLLEDFRGLPHRCEVIGRYKRHAIIEDSKSTNVESTLMALKSLSEPAILLMGGQGKEESYTAIKDYAPQISQLITFGASGSIIAAELRDTIPTRGFPSLAAAIEFLIERVVQTPASVLFSPGCASFDEFTNYSARGDFFAAQIRTRLQLDG